MAVRLSGRFLFVVSCLVISCTTHNAIPYPNDQILMDRLFAHESIFASLASDPKKNLEKLNIIACYSLRENVSVDTFVVWQKDIVGPGGYLKGYHYSEQAPLSVVDSIDEIYNDRPADQVTVFRHIKGPWYLYYSASN